MRGWNDDHGNNANSTKYIFLITYYNFLTVKRRKTGINLCEWKKSIYFARANFCEYELFKFSKTLNFVKRPKFAKTAKVLLAKVSAPKVLALLVTNYVQYPWNIKIQPRFFTDCPLSQFFFFFLIFCNTYEPHTLHKKLSFPVRISSVNVTKSSVPCGFGHIYWKNP